MVVLLPVLADDLADDRRAVGQSLNGNALVRLIGCKSNTRRPSCEHPRPKYILDIEFLAVPEDGISTISLAHQLPVHNIAVLIALQAYRFNATHPSDGCLY